MADKEKGGCFKKKSEEERQAEQVSKDIDNGLKELKKKLTFRLLLLGTGDAGKSTFAKQMCKVYQNGFSKQRREATVPVLHNNVLDSMKELLKAADQWGVKVAKGDKLTAAVKSVNDATTLSTDVADAISALWATDAIKEVFSKGSLLQLPGGNSNVDYFFSNVARFAKEDFLPNDNDMLRAKQKTTGVAEITFTVDGVEFVMVDVGGQRSERRKWLQCFNDVSSVIYLVAINEYDMKMEEDNQTNRMEESLKLFHKLTGSQWLSQVPFILFLNKSDLFNDKVASSPLSKYFEDYDSFVEQNGHAKKTVYEKGLEYIKAQYERAFQGLKLYTFPTNALDTDNCTKVFKAVKDNIVTNAINQSM